MQSVNTKNNIAMKIYKIIPVLFLLFVHNAGLLADELFETPTGTPDAYYGNLSPLYKAQKTQKYCTWDYSTEFKSEAKSDLKSSNKGEYQNIATKAYIYTYENKWEKVEESELVDYTNSNLNEDDPVKVPYIKLNPKKLKSSSTIYVLFVSYAKNYRKFFEPERPINLIKNGAFEEGRTSVSSDYSWGYPKDRYPVNGPGTYTIDKTLVDNNSTSYECTRDHTYKYEDEGGNFFIANGHTQPNKKVWGQEFLVKLYANQLYAFSAWVMNWADDGYGNYPKLQFYLNNESLGDEKEVNGSQCEWEQIYTIWEQKEYKEITQLALINSQLEASGNDFGLDDLFLGEVKKIYQLYTIDIGEYFEPEVISVALCPTLLPTNKQDIEGVKEYIARKLNLDINKLGTEATALSDNMDFEYKEDCDNDKYTSKKIKVTYTETPKKEWQPRTNQQNNTP